jgi:hypothetical protein
MTTLLLLLSTNRRRREREREAPGGRLFETTHKIIKDRSESSSSTRIKIKFFQESLLHYLIMDGTKLREDYCHLLEKGDHVIRWSCIVIYPIQVHGIVLSAGPNIVTIVDFGLTAAKSRNTNKIESADKLEDMVDQEDRAMIDACDKHKSEHEGADRVNIITLVDEKEINKWKKVHYGEALHKQRNWRWWQGKGKDPEQGEKELEKTSMSSATNSASISLKKESSPPAKNISRNVDALEADVTKDKELHRKLSSSWWGCSSSPKKNNDASTSKKQEESKVPMLPDSDPTYLVLSRVRYILTNPKELPPHHIIFSNSECIAVYCKTGRWSTLQASIFLCSTAAGNLKTAILTSAGVAGATSTVTVPASGIAGWFGMTTTATVSLVSLQPWLIPVLAGYGLIAVGTPIILAIRAKDKWERATKHLNDGFWGAAESDVYVEVIKSWSNLK